MKSVASHNMLEQKTPSGAKKKPIEILAPVGNEKMLLAAIHNSADAVYVGLANYNARGRTQSIDKETLRRWLDICRLYQVKFYLAVNIVIFEQELLHVIKEIDDAIAAGVYALICQDIGLAYFLRKKYTNLKIHASTQASIACLRDILFYHEINFDRIVLPREISLAQIKFLRLHTDKELEVFIHGSLCISYSGQCLTSSSKGGRSANRGECAQSCRHLYLPVIDGEPSHDLPAYYLSPFDLRAASLATNLEHAQVDALKIEGRLKTPEYVSAALQNLRHELKREVHNFNPHADRLTFLRGHSLGWLDGSDAKKINFEKFNHHSGIEVGRISQIKDDCLEIVCTLGTPKIVAGDGVAILLPASVRAYLAQRNAAGENIFSGKEIWNQENIRIGSSVYRATYENEYRLKLFFSHEFQQKLRRVKNLSPSLISSFKEASVYLISSPQVEKKLQSSFEDKQNFKKMLVALQVEAKLNHPLRITLIDAQNRCYKKESASILLKSQNRALSKENFYQEFSGDRLPFLHIEKWDIHLQENLFLPLGELKKMRQALLQEYRQAYTIDKKEIIKNEDIDYKNIFSFDTVAPKEKLKPQHEKSFLNLLLRHPRQVEILLSHLDYLQNEIFWQGTVYLNFMYGENFSIWVQKLKEKNLSVGLASELIVNDGDEKFMHDLLDSHPDCLLARNAATAHYFLEKNFAGEIRADYSLNINNSLSAAFFLQKGFTLLTPSYDIFLNHPSWLNEQKESLLFSLLQNSDAKLFEIILSAHIPNFYMEYCLYARLLGAGGKLPHCQRVCRTHNIEMMDAQGVKHSVWADRKCRNTMFHGERREFLSLVKPLQELGTRNFRLEFLSNEINIAEKITELQKILYI